jgi:hypothetical protein
MYSEKDRHLYRNIVRGNTSIPEGQINDRENQKGNQERTSQRNRQHWLHNTQGEDEQHKNTKTKHRQN